MAQTHLNVLLKFPSAPSLEFPTFRSAAAGNEHARNLFVREPLDVDMKIGVSGASGHLGKAVVSELLRRDLNTGKRVWQHNFKTMLWAPLLVTGGDLVFAGGTPDREFRAFDARTFLSVTVCKP